MTKFSKSFDRIESPARTWFAVTPSDATVFDPVPRSIYVGVAGTVVAIGEDGVSGTFTAPAGAILPICPAKIMAASTATGIVALT